MWIINGSVDVAYCAINFDRRQRQRRGQRGVTHVRRRMCLANQQAVLMKTKSKFESFQSRALTRSDICSAFAKTGIEQFDLVLVQFRIPHLRLSTPEPEIQELLVAKTFRALQSGFYNVNVHNGI